jgi:GMP synthase (glutamine-hydrolysing)
MLLIIKAGQKLASLAAVPGDFEHWILQGMGPLQVEARVVSVYEGEALPAHDTVQAVVITGSAAMVTDASDWIEASAAWLRQAVAAQRPVLGICFGHQLLAHALGGRVGDNPNGVEVGTVAVEWMAEAGQDRLFQGLGHDAPLQVSHRQSVLSLPPDARWLARSLLERHQAFTCGERMWGVQFHPEFSAEVVQAYVDHYAAELSTLGRNVAALRGQVQDSDFGSRLLQRFARIAGIAAPA